MYGHEIYKTNDIETASNIKLVVMLYSGSIRFINIAIDGIKQNDFDLANTNIIKAQDILSELLASLNHEAGDIANELSSLYIYIHRLLIEGNIKKNIQFLEEAIELLNNIKIGWDTILEQEESPIQNKNINISG